MALSHQPTPVIAEPIAAAPAHKAYLDGWRGIAIALVLEAHFLNLLPLEGGRLGVDVFFCLSGFLMSGVLFLQRQGLRKFYKRRISRIAPVFVVFVLLIYVFAYRQGLAFTSTEFVSTLFFLRTYIPAAPGIWNNGIPIGHLWSLNIEEHSYIFMSMLVLLGIMRDREGWVLLASGMACIAIGVIYVKLGARAPSWGSLDTEVAASHLLISAGYRLLNERIKPWVPAWLPLLTLLAAVFCYSNIAPWWSRSLLSPFLLAFTANHLSDTGQWFKSLLSTPALRLLGIWSYSIYLWQQPFYSYKTMFPGGPSLALLCAMVTALLSFYALEKTCRSWLNKHW
jgi:peptidoglycan/LPS O-acetylase OafA/YrhL